MDRMDCNRMFVAVMETGSFAAAARRLNASSGQASKLVSRLESDLGVRLLNRTTRKVAPTEVGQAYYDRLRGLLEEFDNLDRLVRNTAQTPRGRLRLSAPLTFGTKQLVPVLTAFSAAYPEISLDVDFTDRVVSLVDEGFDAAIRVGRPADSSLISRKLCETGAVVAAAPAYLARHGMPKRPEGLAGHDCIIDTNFPDPDDWRFEGPSGPLQVGVSGRLRFSNAEACLMAARAGLGVARLPAFVAARSLQTGALMQLLPGYPGPPSGVFVLYPQGRHLAVKVRVLVDYLARHYAGMTMDRWAAEGPPA